MSEASTEASKMIEQPKKSKSRGTLRLFIDNLMRDKLALTGLIIIILFILIAIFGDSLAPYDVDEMHRDEAGEIKKAQPPSKEHWIGTTNYGRDVYSQVIQGTRTEIIVGGLVPMIVTLIM